MDNIHLSICIPTYNFGQFLDETLASIIEQAADEVEIVVGDGGSTDDTEGVVERYQSQFPRLIYHNFGKKGGVDLDLSKTVELARGDYCWLLSSDDVLRPGAMQRVLSEIRLGHSVYLLNRTVCDRNLRPMRRKESWLRNGATDGVFHFVNRSELISYLETSKSIGALFSYMSSIIVHRHAWNEIGYDQRFEGSNYSHVFRLFSILKTDGSSLKYINESAVLCRGDNDSFLDKGVANRFLIDFDGYRLIGESLFFDDGIRNALKRVMRRHHRWYSLSRLRSEVSRSKWKELKDTLCNYGYGSGELLLIDMLGSSKPFVRLLLSIKRLLRA